MVIVSDSQGRELTGLLKHRLMHQCEVSSLIRPGCQMCMVVIDLDGKIDRELLTEDDHLIVIAGSNDVPGSALSGYFTAALDRIKRQNKKTNVIVSEVPLRYDLPWSSRSSEKTESLHKT